MKYFIQIAALFFLTNILLANSCPGFVSNYTLPSYDTETHEFSGKCDENNDPIWGRTDYLETGDGDYFNGFYHSKSWSKKSGTYFYGNGDSTVGHWLKETKTKNGYKYNQIFRAYFENDIEAMGYFYNSDMNGFGIFYYPESSETSIEYEVGIHENNYLNGIGMRMLKNGGSVVGEFSNGDLMGNIYVSWDEENSDEIEKYIVNKDGDWEGPFSVYKKDREKFDEISDFIQENLKELFDWYDNFELEQKEYDNLVETAFSNDDSDINDDSRELVESIQELLKELGYSPGPIDGVLGKRTITAIKAFEYELEMDEITGIPTEELLIALQLILRGEKDQSSSNIEESKIELISTGTGFYITEKNIISNNHVIEGCEYIANGNEERLNIKVADIFNDISLLEGPLSNNYFSIAPDPPALGEKIYLSGYPLNAGLQSFMITSGNVSSLTGLGKNFSNFSHTAPSQPGNSGGPILNAYGSVVGILVASINEDIVKESSGSMPQNINFGIKNTVLKSLLLDNNVSPSIRNSFFSKSQQNIANISKDSSVLIKCYGYR